MGGATGSSSALRNVELKVQLDDGDAAARTARRLSGAAPLVVTQTDTYFQAPSGRLKLREVEGYEPVLIAYARPDDGGARTSAYHLIPVADPGKLRAGLAATLGLRHVVVKERQISLWKNVRIHLDRVEDLGMFLEFEAVLQDGMTEAEGQAQVTHLCAEFGLDESAGIAGSYVDLIAAR